MATGITSSLLYNFPYRIEAFRRIGIGIFGLNIVLFIIFLFMSIARYLIWPTVFTVMCAFSPLICIASVLKRSRL